jgi:large subunit ribosomal protein L15
MKLHELKPNKGAKHRKKRLGSGESSGTGKTCGKGHKGQKSRSGGTIRTGFEGGQMPIHRRLPKKGFSNVAFRDKVVVVNVSSLEERFEAGATIDEAALRAAGLVKGRFDAIKVLGNGDLSKKFEVKAHRVSATARTKIEAAGGSVSKPE